MATITHLNHTASTDNTTSYTSGAFTPSVGDLLVVCVGAGGTARGQLTSSTGQLFIRVAQGTKNSGGDVNYLFVASSLVTSATSQTVTFSCVGDAASACLISVSAVSGMTRTGKEAVKQWAAQNNAAISTTPTVSLASAALTGNCLIGFVVNAMTSSQPTKPSSWTELSAAAGVSTPNMCIQVSGINSGFTSSTVTWGSTSAEEYGAIVAEFDTSAYAATSIYRFGVANETRATPPATPPRLNLGNPITANLLEAVTAFGSVRGMGQPTLYGTAAITQDAKGGTVFTSDDTANDAAAVPLDKSVYTATTKITVAVMIKVSAGANYANYFSIPYRESGWTAPNSSVSLYKESFAGYNNATRFQWASSSTTNVFTLFTGQHVLEDGIWHFYVVVRNGSSVSLYRDGALIETVTAGGNAAIDWGEQRPTSILNASSSSLPNAGYTGSCALQAIFMGALDVGQVKALSNNPWQIFQSDRHRALSPDPSPPTTEATGDIADVQLAAPSATASIIAQSDAVADIQLTAPTATATIITPTPTTGAIFGDAGKPNRGGGRGYQGPYIEGLHKVDIKTLNRDKTEEPSETETAEAEAVIEQAIEAAEISPAELDALDFDKLRSVAFFAELSDRLEAVIAEIIRQQQVIALQDEDDAITALILAGAFL